MDLSHLFSTRVVNYSQLLAAGGALAAGVYFYTKRAGGEVDTVTVVEDQVEDQDTNEALVQPDQVTMCPESPPSSTPGLEERVKELEELLSMAYTECAPKTAECEQQRQTQSVLQAQCNELLCTNEEYLKDNEKALNSIQELEKEKLELMELVSSLRSTIKASGDDIIEANMKCDELKMELIKQKKDFQQQEENIRILQLKYEEMKEELTQKLQDNQKALDFIPQLEKEKSELMELVSSLHSSLKETGEQLIEANIECDELKMELIRKEKDNQKDLDYIKIWHSSFRLNPKRKEEKGDL